MTVRELIAALLEAVEDGAMALDSRVDVSIPYVPGAAELDAIELDVTGISYRIPPDTQGRRRGWVTLELEAD